MDQSMAADMREAELGSISDTVQLYKSEKDKEGNWTWTDKYPENVSDAAENERTAKFAIIVRNEKSEDARKKLQANSLVIQSPWLRSALSEILDRYPGVSCELGRLVIDKPFKPFVHRWHEFSGYRLRKDLDTKTKEHLDILHKILVYEIGDSIASFEDYTRNGQISYADLWMIFPPRGVVISSIDGPVAAFETTNVRYKAGQFGRFLEIRTCYVDYSGDTFGHNERESYLKIPSFQGTRKITSLPVYPLSFREDANELRDTLVRRGARFEKLAGYHYKEYSGRAITWNRDGSEVFMQCEGRIIINILSFNTLSSYPPRAIHHWDAVALRELNAWADKHGVHEDGSYRLDPHHQMLCHSRTRGYSLKLRRWLDFDIDHIYDITWREDAFSKLVLPDDQKNLILAISETQIKGSSFDDIISGKGRGIVCLLSGPPGVGKTLTAEAVAEHLRVPLHTLSSGDLGSNASDLDDKLTSILDLVTRWNGILLIDECDVFLESHSATTNLNRNKAVSIFLRTLEYYAGILFMTTNRIGNIDPAFRSRIHVALEYGALDSNSREAVWRNFISEDMDFSDEDLKELAKLELNGRQIKNVIKTAGLLAARHKKPPGKSFVDTVLAMEDRRPKIGCDVSL